MSLTKQTLTTIQTREEASYAGFFSWLVDHGYAIEGEDPRNVANRFIAFQEANAQRDDDIRYEAKDVLDEQRQARENLEALGRKNSGFGKNRGGL